MKTPRDLTRLTKSELYKKKKERHKQRSNTLEGQDVQNFPFLIYSYHCEVYLSISAYVQKNKTKTQCIVLWGRVDIYIYFFFSLLVIFRFYTDV